MAEFDFWGEVLKASNPAYQNAPYRPKKVTDVMGELYFPGEAASRKIASSEAKREANIANRVAPAPKRVNPYPAGYDPIAENIAGTRPYVPPGQQTGGGGGGGPRMPSVEDMFKPLFANLEQQRRNAESRYSANVGVIENIYGQMVGARSADIPVIEKAYQDLTQAAASRTGELTTDIAAREADRVSQNQQVLASLGISGVGSAAGDLAAEQAQTAQDVAGLSGANWQNLLSGVGAVSQEMARADISGYNFRQGEDVARLNAAKEAYFQDLAGEEANLLAQQEQAKFQQAQARAQAAAAAAAAKARAEADLQQALIRAQTDQSAAAQEAAQRSFDTYMKYADPLSQVIASYGQAGVLDENGASRVRTAYQNFMPQLQAQPPWGVNWDKAMAASAFTTSSAAAGLRPEEISAVRQAISQLFD